MKKISIVLPTYNGEQYIEDAIISILGQTYRNWELIVVDDCSTDGTADIIQRYVCQDPRIQVLHNKSNQKLPASLNIGFQKATGDYFTWTSDDNFYDADALEVMLGFLEENRQYGMVYCGMNLMYEDGTIKRSETTKPAQYMCYENPVGACFLYRREVAKAIGDYDTDMFLVEDYDYWIRIDKQYKLHYLPECKYTYRVHKASLTQTKMKRAFIQRWRLRQKELDYLLARIDESEKWVPFLEMWVCRKRETWELREKFFPGGKLPREIAWIEKRMEQSAYADDGRPLILFGAGDYGQRAMRYFAKERIRCFVDNNEAMAGKNIDGIPIISFSHLKELSDYGQIILAVRTRLLPEIIAQLEEAGIQKYGLFLEILLNDGI